MRTLRDKRAEQSCCSSQSIAYTCLLKRIYHLFSWYKSAIPYLFYFNFFFKSEQTFSSSEFEDMFNENIDEDDVTCQTLRL